MSHLQVKNVIRRGFSHIKFTSFLFFETTSNSLSSGRKQNVNGAAVINLCEVTCYADSVHLTYLFSTFHTRITKFHNNISFIHVSRTIHSVSGMGYTGASSTNEQVEMMTFHLFL